jgi:hypothetical protein
LSYKKAPKESDIFLSYITNKYIFFWWSLLIPKKAFDEVWKFKDLRTTQDYDMWLRMLKAWYKFINQSKFLNKCRIHWEQDSINKKGLMLKEQKIVQKYIFQIFCLNELKEKSWYKYNKYLLYIYIKLILYKNNVLWYSTIFCQKIWIYNLIAPMYRKLFIK